VGAGRTFLIHDFMPGRQEDRMKQCTVCGNFKGDDEFGWRWKDLGIRQGTCRGCRTIQNRKWYEGHKQVHLENVQARKKDHRRQARQFVWDYLLDHPCAKCGEADPHVLEFHHLHGKDKAISVMVADGWSIERIRVELEKCAVLCANCHRRVTAREQKWFRG
jgi:hypothetical protein